MRFFKLTTITSSCSSMLLPMNLILFSKESSFHKLSNGMLYSYYSPCMYAKVHDLNHLHAHYLAAEVLDPHGVLDVASIALDEQKDLI